MNKENRRDSHDCYCGICGKEFAVVCKFSSHIDPTTTVLCPFGNNLCRDPCEWALEKSKERIGRTSD